MDPYRSDLDSRVSRLEKKVETLQMGGTGTIIGGIREGLHEGFKTGSIWAGSAVTIVVLAMIFTFPSCARSCSKTSEEIQAEQAAQTALVEEHEHACQALGMSYIGYNSYILTCGNQTDIVSIDLRHRDNPIRTQHLQAQ